MTVRPPGRPPRGQPTVSRDVMLSAALDILDSSGAEALTMRALATRLGVNPMTLYHHFSDKDGLIKALAEDAYRKVLAPDQGSTKDRIRGLLLSYQLQVLRHPGLTLTIFSTPTVFPDQAKRITADLEGLLRDLGLSPSRSRLWVNILVDFTHGAALATAMQGGKNAGGTAECLDDDYVAALAELLDGLDGST